MADTLTKTVAHTPGPWTADRNWVHGGPLNLPLATTYDGIRHETLATDPSFKREIATRSREEVNANARLIAAAPELLAALKLYVDHFGDPLKVARAAIAKAEGAK